MSNQIENIIFSRFVTQPIPFEFITIKELYKRCKENVYDLSIPHRIAFNALIIITQGRSFHDVDFKKTTLSPGTILPLSKNQVHAFNKELHVEGYIISFEENFITEHINETSLFHFLHIFDTPIITVSEENTAVLMPFLNILKALHNDSNSNMKGEIINAILMALLFQIKRLSSYQNEIYETKRFKDFIRFKQLIKEHYHESHNVKEYAKRLSVSYKYLNDICKQITNKTAKTFLDNWLLLEIKRNILEDKYSSQEIAFKMGFNEPSNFIRFFKKFTNSTPNQFLLSLKK